MTWKNTILIIAAVLWFNTANAQTKKAFIQAADNFFFDQDYYNAMDAYKKVLEFGGDQLDIRYRYAQAARNFNSYELADSLFQFVYDMDAENYPLSSYYIAEMNQQKGSYEEALENYRLYLSLNDGTSEFHTLKAQKEIEACEWALENINGANSNSKITRLGNDVNSEFSEFGATVIGDSLYFSSLRFPNEEDGFTPHRLTSKILIKPESLEAKPLLNKINYSANKLTAHTAFTDDLSGVFYTLCDYTTATEIRCDIYYAEVDENQEIIAPGIKLPDHINLFESTQTHPMVAGDELYFVSDRDGGKGMLDIWVTQFNVASMSFTEPSNLSTINSAYDDVTPFINADGDFFFSSEGYIGFGGFDVYSANIDNPQRPNVKNLGIPTNSSYHDLYYYESDKGDKYIASNRSGSNYIESESEACCFDIYELELEDYDIRLDAITFDALSMDSLYGARVDLVCKDNGEVMESILNTEGANHEFNLEPNKSYLLIGTKDGFYPDTVMFHTRNISSDTLIIKKLFLERNDDYIDPSSIELDLSVFDQMTGLPILGATLCIVDPDNPNEPIVMTSFDSNQFKTRLDRNKEYTITVKKDGYDPYTFQLDTSEYEGQSTIEKTVYLKPNSGEIDDILPLTLYFDNDNPNEKCWRPTTEKTYSETYFAYIVKKETYKQNYAGEGTGEERILNMNAVDDFFVNELEYGYSQLQRLMPLLLNRLQNGEQFSLVVNGYASPKFSAAYNQKLSERRINSIKNEFNSYGGGALRPYFDTGALELVESPYGESNAPFNVSDSQKDRRNSVYSPEASRERKIEILKIQTSNGL